MNKMKVYPGRPLKGEVYVPGDKSMSHRAALFAGLANGKSIIHNLLVAGVTNRMLAALTDFGIRWELNGTTLTVEGPGSGGWKSPTRPVDCGNSATTIRLLAGAVAAAGVPAILDGSAGLRRRPMDRIIEPLRLMGLPITGVGEAYAPLEILESAGKLDGINYILPVASAQLKSCLLLAGLNANTPTTLVEPGPSRDHTERMLASMGAQIRSQAIGGAEVKIEVEPLHGHPLHPLEMSLPGDFSAASFLIAAALITPGSAITLPAVGLNPTRTGLLDALLEMGADIKVTHVREQAGEPVGDIHARYSDLHGVEINGAQVVRMIDEFPIFAVAAAFAKGETRVTDAEELRYKESDRIAALARQLSAVGVSIQELPDGFVLPGNTPPQGGEIDPAGDHRIAMSLAVAGLASEAPITIKQPEIIHESFPAFAKVLTALGAYIEELA